MANENMSKTRYGMKIDSKILKDESQKTPAVME